MERVRLRGWREGTIEALVGTRVNPIPIGNVLLTMKVRAEDQSEQRHYVVLSRAASGDATLRSLQVQFADLLTNLVEGLSRRHFDIALHRGSSKVRISASGPAGSTVTVNDVPVPCDVDVNNQRTAVLTLKVMASDGYTAREYTLVVTCGHCTGSSEDGGEGGDGTSRGALDSPISSINGNMWLMFVLLTAASTLCCLSLLVCIRMQCIRAAQRRRRCGAIPSSHSSLPTKS